MTNIKALQNSIDVLQATLNGLLKRNAETKATLALRLGQVRQLQDENDLLTTAVKDLAIKLGEKK